MQWYDATAQKVDPQVQSKMPIQLIIKLLPNEDKIKLYGHVQTEVKQNLNFQANLSTKLYVNIRTSSKLPSHKPSQVMCNIPTSVPSDIPSTKPV